MEEKPKMGGLHAAAYVTVADDFCHPSMSLHVKEDEFKTLPVYQHLRKDLPKITYVYLGAVIDKSALLR